MNQICIHSVNFLYSFQINVLSICLGNNISPTIWRTTSRYIGSNILFHYWSHVSSLYRTNFMSLLRRSAHTPATDTSPWRASELFSKPSTQRGLFSHNKFFRVCAFVGPLNVIIEFVGCGGASYYNMQKFPPTDAWTTDVCSFNLLYLILDRRSSEVRLNKTHRVHLPKTKKLENFESILFL